MDAETSLQVEASDDDEPSTRAGPGGLARSGTMPSIASKRTPRKAIAGGPATAPSTPPTHTPTPAKGQAGSSRRKVRRAASPRRRRRPASASTPVRRGRPASSRRRKRTSDGSKGRDTSRKAKGKRGGSSAHGGGAGAGAAAGAGGGAGGGTGAANGMTTGVVNDKGGLMLNYVKPRVIKKLNRSQRSRLASRPRAGTRAFGKTPVDVPDAPPVVGPYSAAVRARGMVFVSGTIGIVPGKGKKKGKGVLAKVRKPKLREPPEFMREEERLKQLEANQKRWEKYLRDCLVAETVQAMENLEVVLQESGSSLSHVVQMNVHLTAMKALNTVNTVCAKFFVEDPPARTVIQVKGLRNSAQVQFDCVALTN